MNCHDETYSCHLDKGKKAYEIYRQAVGNKSFDGKPLFNFELLPMLIKIAWTKVALEV